MGSSLTSSGFIHIILPPVAKVPSAWVVRLNVGWRKTNFSLIGTTRGRISRVKGGVPLVVPEKKTSALRKMSFGCMTIPMRISITSGSVHSPSPSSTVDDSNSSDGFFMEEEFMEQTYNDEEISKGFDWLEEGQRVVYLESWQMKKMVAAANLGASCVNVEALAVEVGLDSFDVLAWLNDTPSKTVILENTSEGLSYMEDVHIEEDSEKEAVYVPPPPIPVRDVNMRKKVENLMYTLKGIMKGPLADIIADEKKWKATVNLFCETVELQNPLFCLRGRDELFEWVQLLGRVGVGIKLHYLYYQNTVKNPYRRWVYATFTATFTSDLLKSVVQLGLTDWWNRCHGPEPDLHENQRTVENQSMNSRVLQLSGEYRFEMDESGQVTSVNTKWYKLAEEGGGQDFKDSRIWLSGLLRQYF